MPLRVAVTGLIAAGKTTFASKLASATGLALLDIKDFDGDWDEFRVEVFKHDAVITESVAKPRGELDYHIHVFVSERLRQKRLEGRPGQPIVPLARYDYRDVADLLMPGDCEEPRQFEIAVAHVERLVAARPRAQMAISRVSL